MSNTHCARCGCEIVQPKTNNRKRCIECSIIRNKEKNAEDQRRYRVKRILSEQRSPLLSKGQRAIMGSS